MKPLARRGKIRKRRICHNLGSSPSHFFEVFQGLFRRLFDFLQFFLVPSLGGHYFFSQISVPVPDFLGPSRDLGKTQSRKGGCFHYPADTSSPRPRWQDHRPPFHHPARSSRVSQPGQRPPAPERSSIPWALADVVFKAIQLSGSETPPNTPTGPS